MRELTILSGKGGTGKTTVTAAFAALAENAVIVDCDVETPNLHLLLQPEIEQQAEFVGGKRAVIDPQRCVGCGRCAELCRFNAIIGGGPPTRLAPQTYAVHALRCEGCGLCVHICPTQAAQMVPAVCGEWYVSRTARGPFVHARLYPGHGNSGKLVTHLRKTARQVAAERQADWLINDGVPGVGCPAIAALAHADAALVVVEPTVAGRHDLHRVLDLARHFRVPAQLIVNRFDVNADLTAEIEQSAAARGVPSLGRIPHDAAIYAAQRAGRSIMGGTATPAADALRRIWQRVVTTPPVSTAYDPEKSTV